MRECLRKKISKQTRHKIIVWLVRNRYWYNQGSATFSAFDDIVPIGMIMLGASVVKYLFNGVMSLWIPYTVLGVGLFLRVIGKWYTGRFWHNGNGYDIETEWNRGKVPPSRTEIINVEEIAEAVVRRLRNG